ncbi:MAG: ribonuclease P protein component [Oscillospiraceae bacterium]|nr:ribonuclease P protein component [Oscillospiraceae bacterium]MBQ8923137.1 ribonuclease P protein component [Oscillospiraceae bacterium]
MLFTQKLNNNADFQRLYRKGAFCSLGSALIYVMPNKLPYNRLGITAGKKIGNAVKRNRAKRIIRAAYSAAELQMPVGIDLVFVARSTLPEQKSDVLTHSLLTKGVRHCQGVSSGEIPCTQNPKPPQKRRASAGAGK